MLFQILSGFRLLLVYSLYQPGLDIKLSASQMNKEIRDFKDILAKWKAFYEKTGKLHLLAYVLQKPEESEYQFLVCEKLEETDRYKVQFLRENSGEAGFCIFLASMSCTTDENGVNGERHICLLEVVDLDGYVEARNVTLQESNIIQTDAFDDRDSVDSEDDYTHYRGYYDDVRPQHYRDRVRD